MESDQILDVTVGLVVPSLPDVVGLGLKVGENSSCHRSKLAVVVLHVLEEVLYQFNNDLLLLQPGGAQRSQEVGGTYRLNLGIAYVVSEL